jgi:hypothetical protein
VNVASLPSGLGLSCPVSYKLATLIVLKVAACVVATLKPNNRNEVVLITVVIMFIYLLGFCFVVTLFRDYLVI